MVVFFDFPNRQCVQRLLRKFSSKTAVTVPNTRAVCFLYLLRYLNNIGNTSRWTWRNFMVWVFGVVWDRDSETQRLLRLKLVDGEIVGFECTNSELEKRCQSLYQISGAGMTKSMESCRTWHQALMMLSNSVAEFKLCRQTQVLVHFVSGSIPLVDRSLRLAFRKLKRL